MRRYARFVVWAVAWFLPFHLVIRFLLDDYAVAAFWKEALIASALAGIAAASLRGVPARTFRGVPVAGILLFCAMGVAWAIARTDRTAMYGLAGFTVYIALFVVALYGFDREHVPRLIGWIIAPAVLVTIGALVQLVASDTMYGLVIAYELAGSGRIRVTSFLGSSILLAPYLAMTILLTAAAALRTPHTGRRIAAALATVLMLYALVNTWSRGGWLQLMLGGGLFMLLMVLFSPGHARTILVRRLALGFAVVLCVVPIAFALFDLPVDTEVFTQRLASAVNWSTDRGNLERLRAWSATWQFIGSSPAGLLVGIGPGEGWYFASTEGFDGTRYTGFMAAQGLPAVTESFWFLLLLNYGAIGLIVFMGLYLSMLWRGFRMLRRMTDRSQFIYCAALLANLGSMFVELSWLQSITSIYIGMLIWMQFAILMIMSRDLENGATA